MSQRFFSKVLGFIGYAVQYGCIAHCTFEYVGEFVVCSGPSMEPTIANHDVVFSERLSRRLYRIEKGDIVIAKSPFDPKMNICKRVIGLEGDKVCTSGPLDPFKTHTFDQSQDGTSHHINIQSRWLYITVPRGHVWLEGDNLKNSTDSRCYGPVPYGLIQGRVCLKVQFPRFICT
ncbi:mitochondrial inner membrane protease subunit 1 isoform X2 [Ictalurus punctatus]|uniref:Mitochondrial inner membrane protease subunit n=1 Tax=Ictalurus punctatus TaxID=7998 RepID=A0A9F7RF40_ICTPU|nr:mitochondrial inner membrane protease subunit 1 isoform X2 [Ictalurus punctatus]